MMPPAIHLPPIPPVLYCEVKFDLPLESRVDLGGVGVECLKGNAALINGNSGSGSLLVGVWSACTHEMCSFVLVAEGVRV